MILAKTASVASDMVQEGLELDANTSNEQRKEEGNQQQGEQGNLKEEKELPKHNEVEVCSNKLEMNSEQQLRILAYKKFAGDKITDKGKHICHSSFRDIMPAKQVLMKVVTSLLKKSLLNEFKLCAIELSLSTFFKRSSRTYLNSPRTKGASTKSLLA